MAKINQYNKQGKAHGFWNRWACSHYINGNAHGYLINKDLIAYININNKISNVQCYLKNDKFTGYHCYMEGQVIHKQNKRFGEELKWQK